MVDCLSRTQRGHLGQCLEKSVRTWRLFRFVRSLSTGRMRLGWSASKLRRMAKWGTLSLLLFYRSVSCSTFEFPSVLWHCCLVTERVSSPWKPLPLISKVLVVVVLVSKVVVVVVVFWKKWKTKTGGEWLHRFTWKRLLKWKRMKRKACMIRGMREWETLGVCC